MNESHINECINKAKIGIEKYRKIQKKIRSTDVSSDIDFQTQFNHFYKIRQKNKNWYLKYYRLMEDLKSKESVDFSYIIKDIYGFSCCLEASFSSKMLATLNANMPVWDRFVLDNLNIKPPPYKSKERMKLMIQAYEKICNWYNDNLQAEEGMMIISIFNKKISNANEFSDTKKIDFVLWQSRSGIES